MAYTDKTFFLKNMSEAELNNLIDSEDNNLIDKIKVADDEIDSYLRSRIKVLPLSNPPMRIKQCSFDITVYYLHSRTQKNQIPDRVRLGYEDAIEYLLQISRGNIQLFSTPEIPSENKESQIEVTGEDTVMGRDMF